MKLKLPYTSADFKKNELKTLEYIRSRGFFEGTYVELANSLNEACFRHRGILKNANGDFGFTSNFYMEVEGEICEIILHGSVIGDFNLTTYSLSICRDLESKELIRRFHFDYLHQNSSLKQASPIYHMQYGGKLGGVAAELGFKTNKIEDWISEPRLLHHPINLALLLDMVFCEFRTIDTTKIIDDSEWRSLIKENETFLLKYYYSTISDHLKSSSHSKDFLVRDIYYGVRS